MNGNFRIFWLPEGGESTEVCFDGSFQNALGQVKRGSCGGLSWFLQTSDGGETQLRVINEGKNDVTGRALVTFDWQNPETGYTLVPGVYYNGNYTDFLNTATYLHLPEREKFRISLAATATPCALVWDGKEGGTFIGCSISSSAGYNGIELNGRNETMSFSVPAGDDDCNGTHEIKRYPHTWHRHDIVSVCLRVRSFRACCPADVFSYYWDACRDVPGNPQRNSFRRDEAATAALVRDWLLSRHCVDSEDGHPIIKNATCDFELPVKPESIQEWNDMIGWCSGTMTALPLLAEEGEARRTAIRYIDFLTSEGFSPCGIKLPIYDGHTWIDPRPGFCPAEGNQYCHVRFFGDYLYYLGRAIEYENGRGEKHPGWEADFERETEILLDLWEREHDFGMYWDLFSKKLAITYGGTGAGAYALLALTQACKLGVQTERVRKALLEADDVYYARCIATGRCTAGPNDIRNADDSESIAAMTDAFTQQFVLFGEEKLKKYAVEAGHIFSSWVLSYAPSFPVGSALNGINVCGGVIANVQNRHIGPGICTNSGRFLRTLGEITSDAHWTRLYDNVRAAASNCVCGFDGEFMGGNLVEVFRKGMVTEQINAYDVYSKPGYAWCVSASWPATNVLLSHFDK